MISKHKFRWNVLLWCANLQICVHHSQFVIIEDIEQLLHQSITGQGLVVDDAGELTLALQQFPPWRVQQRITQSVDSCWVEHEKGHAKYADTQTNIYASEHS